MVWCLLQAQNTPHVGSPLSSQQHLCGDCWGKADPQGSECRRRQVCGAAHLGLTVTSDLWCVWLWRWSSPSPPQWLNEVKTGPTTAWPPSLTRTLISHTHTHTYSYTPRDLHTQTHVYTHTDTQTHVYIHTLTHTQMYILTQSCTLTVTQQNDAVWGNSFTAPAFCSNLHIVNPWQREVSTKW